MKFILIAFLFSLTLFAEEKPKFDIKEFDKLLGYSCPPKEFAKRFFEAEKKGLPKGEYIRKTLGGDNFTHFLITNNPSTFYKDRIEFNIGHDSSLVFKVISQNAAICNHKDIKHNIILSSNDLEVKGFIIIRKENIIHTRIIYTYDLKSKEFTFASIAKINSRKAIPGKLIFDKKSKASLKKDPNVPAIKYNVDYGTLTGRQFNNKYFHFKLEIPENWHIENENMLDEYDTKAKKYIRHKSLKGDDKPSMKHLSISKEKPGDKFKKFPIFAVTSIPLPKDLQKKKSEEYLAILKEGFKAAPFKPEFLGEIKPIKFQNLDFAHMKFSIKVGDLPKAYQEYFLIVFKGRALSFIINYHDEEARKELQPILESLRFSK